MKRKSNSNLTHLCSLCSDVLWYVAPFYEITTTHFLINDFQNFQLLMTSFSFLLGFTSPHQSYSNDTFHYSSRPKQQQLYHSTSTENFELDYNSNDKEVINNALNRGPYFETSASKNVTALVGKTAYLNCRIRNLGNKTVS